MSAIVVFGNIRSRYYNKQYYLSVARVASLVDPWSRVIGVVDVVPSIHKLIINIIINLRIFIAVSAVRITVRCRTMVTF